MSDFCLHPHTTLSPEEIAIAKVRAKVRIADWCAALRSKPCMGCRTANRVGHFRAVGASGPLCSGIRWPVSTAAA